MEKIKLINKFDGTPIKNFSPDSVTFSINEIILKLGKQKTLEKEKQLMKTMYEMYKDKYNNIYIVSEREFEKFMKWALPLYSEIGVKK